MSLAEAEARALRRHPQLAEAQLRARAAESRVTQSRAARMPSIDLDFTGAATERGGVIGAGALNAPGLFNRFAGGFLLNQTLYDFGRTTNAILAAQAGAEAGSGEIVSARARILLRVRVAYYTALAAQAAERVAQDNLNTRTLTLKQVRALADSQLRSTMDVSFAEVAVSEAELAVFGAQSATGSAMADLAAAMGEEYRQDYVLHEESTPQSMLPPPEKEVADALRERPDLGVERSRAESLARQAEAERRLVRPTVSLTGAAGWLPLRESRMNSRYDGVAVNLRIPVFNGKLLRSRGDEATFRAQAAAQQVRDLELRVAQQVRKAWLEAENARRRMDVTRRLVRQADQSLRLARARYDLGLGSIVELTQAQYNQTAAQIADTTARYEYQSRRSLLDFETGRIQ